VSIGVQLESALSSLRESFEVRLVEFALAALSHDARLVIVEAYPPGPLVPLLPFRIRDHNGSFQHIYCSKVGTLLKQQCPILSLMRSKDWLSFVRVIIHRLFPLFEYGLYSVTTH
jgi:hypothetical protein